VWPVATHGCESWTLRKNEETRLGTFEMKGLRKILQVLWTAKKNKWVLNKARKLAYYGHTMRKLGSCLEKEVMQGTMPGARRRGSPRMAWMDNINTWTGLPVEESIRMTEDRDELGKCGQPSDRGQLKYITELPRHVYFTKTISTVSKFRRNSKH